MYKHRCLENIKKLYTSVVKYDDQHQYKAIIEAALVSTTDIFTDNNPMSPEPSITVRNPSARKPIRLFTEVLYVKKKTGVVLLNQSIRQSEYALCCGRL